MAQLLARITQAAALHILIATRSAPGHWHERQREAEAAAAGCNPYAAAAAAAAAASSSSNAVADHKELGLAELLPWRLWALQSVMNADSAGQASLVHYADFARPSLLSLASEGRPCLLDLLYTGPFILPADRECGFLLERLAVLLLRYRSQQQQQQMGGQVTSQVTAGSSSSLTAAEVQQLLSELLSRDVVFQHVPPQQRVQEFLQQLWPGSSTKDVAAAAGKPYVGTHLELCCGCSITPKKLRSGTFHKCDFCVTCICGKCLASLDKEAEEAALAAAASKGRLRFYCPFCEGHPDVLEVEANHVHSTAVTTGSGGSQHPYGTRRQQQQQQRNKPSSAATLAAAGGSGSSGQQAAAAAAVEVSGQEQQHNAQRDVQQRSAATSAGQKRSLDQQSKDFTAAAASSGKGLPASKRQHSSVTQSDVQQQQQHGNHTQPGQLLRVGQQQQQKQPLDTKPGQLLQLGQQRQQQQQQHQLQQQLEQICQAADRGFKELFFCADNNAASQAVLAAIRMKKLSLVSSFEETGDVSDLIGLQALTQAVQCLQQASAAARPLLLLCMAEPVAENGSSSSNSSSSSVLDLLLGCWLREVQLTGCSIAQSAAAAAEAVPAGFAGAGSSSSAAAADDTLRKLVAGLCQMLLQLLLNCCEAAAAAPNAGQDVPAAAAGSSVVQLASSLMLGTSMLLLHWPGAACCSELLCQQVTFWRQLIWIYAQQGAAVQVDVVNAQISNQVQKDLLKQHCKAVKAAAAAAEGTSLQA
jgi:hypothetical protein